jgi:hypothetical protein
MSTIPESSIHEQTAMAMLVQLRELAQSVKGFNFTSPTHRRRLAAQGNVPDAFLRSVAVACDAAPTLASSGGVTGAELRDMMAFARAYLSVADELELLAKGLRDTVAQHRAEGTEKALRVYFIAKRINRPAEREALIPHLRNMTRDLGKTRPKAPADAVPAKPPEPAPVPAVPEKKAGGTS